MPGHGSCLGLSAVPFGGVSEVFHETPFNSTGCGRGAPEAPLPAPDFIQTCSFNRRPLEAADWSLWAMSKMPSGGNWRINLPVASW